MIKKFVMLLLLALSSTLSFADNVASLKPAIYSCPDALPSIDPNFCASFESVAKCHCRSSGLPSSLCQDVNALYNRMVSIFGSLERACRYQHHTSTQICMDDWVCYRKGGKDSSGGLCSASGKSCQ